MTKDNNFTGSIHNSYSQALYELAVENNEIERVEEQTKAVLRLLSESKELSLFISNPITKQDDQKKVFNLISEKYSFNELLKKYLNFLIEKRRLFFIEKILKDFLNICSNKRGEVIAVLSAAKNLDETEIKKIKDELSNNFGKKIKLNFMHKPELIGGLVIKVGSVMVDTSIKNKLQQIENKMIEA